MKIVSISVTEAGRRHAKQLPFETIHKDAALSITKLWNQVDGFVVMLAIGATLRIIAPLLKDKHNDPVVVCVDEQARFVIPISGSHRGANELSDQIASILNAEVVTTTATDISKSISFDLLDGFSATGDIAGVSTSLIDGQRIRVMNKINWPLPSTIEEVEDLDKNGSLKPVVVIDHKKSAFEKGVVVLHPPCLVVGIGTSSDANSQQVQQLLDRIIDKYQLAPESIESIATIEKRLNHPALMELNKKTYGFSSQELSKIKTPNPSTEVANSVGTPSVCEAAALLAAGPDSELIVQKQKNSTVTIAIAKRKKPRGKLSIVGIGPGGKDFRTIAAIKSIQQADFIIGYKGYLQLCADLISPSQHQLPYPLGKEVQRAQKAIELAMQGNKVSLISSGDPGIYAMASITFELIQYPIDYDIETISGITAASSSAALLGAPLGHDNASISLSDLLTPWEEIENKITQAAKADFVITFYNPKSQKRNWQLKKALKIISNYRNLETPIGIVTNAGRSDQKIFKTTLGHFEDSQVDMNSCVIVGSSKTLLKHNTILTPRGYVKV